MESVSRFFAKLSLKAVFEIFARFDKACGKGDTPAVQRIAELANEHELVIGRAAHDADGIGLLLSRSCAFELPSIGFGVFAGNRFVGVEAPVGHGIGKLVFLDPSVAHLLDVVQDGLWAAFPIAGERRGADGFVLHESS